MFLSVIIPAYNEEARLPDTLLATAGYFEERFPGDYEILVIDDGSTDRTADSARLCAEKCTAVVVQILSYGANRGKGYAVRYGMLRARGRQRLFTDADLATPIEEYQVVVDATQKYAGDIGIGSRPLKQSQLLVRQPAWREALGRSFNKIVQLSVPGIDDTQCGFKIFTAAAAEDVFSRCRLDRFAFDVEALFIARRLGYRIVEAPIRWSHKEGSKVNMLRDGIKMLADLARIYQMHNALTPAAALTPSPKP
jgi:dolichyl-phosphate beta-glucosyltransferase